MQLSRDVRIASTVAVWVLVVLGLDTVATLPEQRLLGAGTWVLLLLALRGESRATRVQVGIVVLYATTVEYVFAGWLGVYVYRLSNVPAFVPPGHGLVYLAALALGRSAFAHRHGRLIVQATVVVCGGWVAWGLALSPRHDVLGALWFGCLLVFMRRGRTPLVYCGAFVVTSYLELIGTGLGTWAWQPHDPTGVLSIGNPPSGIAGGYCFFDAAALWLTPRLLARYDRARAASAASCSLPLVHTTLPPFAVETPARSVKAPPASSTMTCSAARSHNETSGSHEMSTAPSATSTCDQKSPNALDRHTVRLSSRNPPSRPAASQPVRLE
jgi:hypothetical protein